VKPVTPHAQSNVIASYDDYYTDPGRLRDSDAFYRWVLKKLKPIPGRQLLDIACGEGHLLRAAAEQGLCATGVDFSTQAIRSARQIAQRAHATIADAERLPFPKHTFDYATNLGSLEHFWSPEQGLREMGRVLKPDGLAALVLPNSYYVLDIVWSVWRRGYPVSHKQAIERFATAGEWRDLIQAHGLQVIRSHKYNFCFPRSRADVRWYARFPRKVAYVLLSPFTPFNLSYSFLFICRRHEPT
jgi:ubiquinone/menaquinone biosynthesis C-methylase UbiE